MVSSLFFYQLALIALLWLCLLLQYAWPSDQAVIRPTPPELTPSRRKRRHDLKSFEGLTTRLSCKFPQCGPHFHALWCPRGA
jgi:hypothetical protein